MAKTFHRLQVRDVRQETPDCISVAFETPDELDALFDYTAGQYLTLRADIDGEEVRRSYSICTSPDENDLRVAIKRVPSGQFSTFAHESLSIGDSIEVLPPAGRFFAPLDATQSKHYLTVAAGSGITPIIALIKDILKREPMSHVTLLYGNKNRGSVIFKSQLADLKNRFVDRFSVFHVFSREQLETPLLEGRIDAAKLEQFFASIVDKKQLDEVFLCGPEAMTLEIRSFLLDSGFTQSQIHMELFGSKKAAEAVRRRREASGSTASDALCHVTVKVDGAALNISLNEWGESILDAALAAGADLPFACKGGVCTTCKAQLEAGEVEMDVNYGLEPDEVSSGLILTCQSHPKSPEVVVNYDVR